MNLNDLEILNFHFRPSLNFRYYEPRFSILGYIFTVESVYTHVTSGDVRSAEADRDPQCLESAKKTADLS